MTVVERIMEDISFNCDTQESKVVIDEAHVDKYAKDLKQQIDLNRFIL
tara:strand:+ start:2517 stop:2660 length:144 start_codon:yes stop_codon:yes gene_type:complete